MISLGLWGRSRLEGGFWRATWARDYWLGGGRSLPWVFPPELNPSDLLSVGNWKPMKFSVLGRKKLCFAETNDQNMENLLPEPQMLEHNRGWDLEEWGAGGIVYFNRGHSFSQR